MRTSTIKKRSGVFPRRLTKQQTEEWKEEAEVQAETGHQEQNGGYNFQIAFSMSARQHARERQN